MPRVFGGLRKTGAGAATGLEDLSSASVVGSVWQPLDMATGSNGHKVERIMLGLDYQ